VIDLVNGLEILSHIMPTYDMIRSGGVYISLFSLLEPRGYLSILTATSTACSAAGPSICQGTQRSILLPSALSTGFLQRFPWFKVLRCRVWIVDVPVDNEFSFAI
jgi:hypothetical protein